MARVKRSVMEANALRLLAYLDARASGEPRVAVVPLRAMVADLQMTQARVRRLVHLLDEWGCIEVRHCFAADGGGQPNEHRITGAGSAALEACRAAAPAGFGTAGAPGAPEFADGLMSREYA